MSWDENLTAEERAFVLSHQYDDLESLETGELELLLAAYRKVPAAGEKALAILELALQKSKERERAGG